MNTLYELTGQESGIVIYEDAEGVLCNWSNVFGYPKIDPLGISVIGMNEEIPEVEGKHFNNLSSFFNGISITNMSCDDPEIPTSGTVYKVTDNINVIAPDDWC
jgi:hypothetical protein